MLFKHADREILYKTPMAVGCRLAVVPEAELVEMVLDPGGQVPAHALDIPVTFYVISGTGTIRVDSDCFTVSAGDVVSSEAGSTRELTHTGKGEFKLLVIKHTGS